MGRPAKHGHRNYLRGSWGQAGTSYRKVPVNFSLHSRLPSVRKGHGLPSGGISKRVSAQCFLLTGRWHRNLSGRTFLRHEINTTLLRADSLPQGRYLDGRFSADVTAHRRTGRSAVRDARSYPDSFQIIRQGVLVRVTVTGQSQLRSSLL